MVLEYRYIQVAESIRACAHRPSSVALQLRCAQRVGTAVRLGLIANCNAARGCHCQLSVAYNPNIASYQVLSTAPESG